MLYSITDGVFVVQHFLGHTTILGLKEKRLVPTKAKPACCSDAACREKK
jgi:hypothetical protein